MLTQFRRCLSLSPHLEKSDVGMEHSDRNQRSYGQDVYDEQNRAQIPRMYASSMNAARFRMPQLPHQQSNSAAPSTSFSGHSFLDHEHYVAGSIPGGFQYPSHSAVEGADHMGYGTQQQHTSMSYGPSGYLYGSQPTQHDQYYQSSNVRSMSMSSSHLDVAQTPQLYSQQSQSSSSNSGILENMPLPQQNNYQMPNVSYGNYATYSSQQQYATQNSPPEMNEPFEQYKTRTKEIFTLVKNRQLASTADVLVQISQYLIGNVEALGLDRDDKSQHAERLKLWDTFNQCWLTTLQAQLDMTRIMQRKGVQPSLSESILEANTLEGLGQELVRLCDGVENIGLVDYQMGVAEEEIVDLLIKCLDVVRPLPADTPRASGSTACI